MSNMSTFFEASDIRAPSDLVIAHDAMRSTIDALRRRNRAVPPELRAAAEALEAEIMEAQFDNLPI